MADYAGESLAKKVARVRLYKRAREALKFRLPSLKGIKALFLIGDTASEVGALKHILGVEPQNMTGIDRDPEACRVLREKVPAARACCGDMLDETFVVEVRPGLEETSRFQFMHLDLMGNLSEKTQKIYAYWGEACAMNGVCATTYLRGRETQFTRDTLHAIVAADIVGAAEPVYGGIFTKGLPDVERATGHYSAINAALSYFGEYLLTAGDLDALKRKTHAPAEEYYEMLRKAHDLAGIYSMIASHSYRAEVSPMGFSAYQRVPLMVHKSKPYRKFTMSGGRLTTSTIKKDPMEDLLLEADSLDKEFTNQQVAEILDVSTGTLAAWRAHRTRGTYAE